MGELTDIVRFSRIATNGIHLHVAEAGPAGGPLVFLLHGFPEFWYGWRNQIAPLARSGFHVVAPDQRGYNLSDKPKGIASYDLDQLAADIVGLGDHFRAESFDICGHDWGASVGWWLAGQNTGRVRRLVAVNAPHPAVWVDAMRNDPAQKAKSWYVRFFRTPYVPELLIGANRSKALGQGLRDIIRPGAMTEADLEQYRKAWAQPGAVTAMIHYYRALLRKPLEKPSAYRITCPTLVIWGRQDAYGTAELAEASIQLCSDGRLVYLDRATHWAPHDEPEKIAAMITEFLR
jgi:epoxide hydrolase 4